MVSRARLVVLVVSAAFALAGSGCASHDGAPATSGVDREDPPQPEAAERGGAGRGSGKEQRRPDNQEGTKKKPTLLRLGDSGSLVTALQRELEGLGYWMGPADGAFDDLTEQAVLAFQGVEGLTRDGVVGPKTRAALRSSSRPRPRSSEGDLIEVDEDRQVLLIVRDGRTRWVIHVSTGTDERYRRRDGNTSVANTPDGKWKMMYQYADGWHKSPLGRLWRPKYFHSTGIAIHGFPSVPPYPASHGCVRVSLEAMDFIWEQHLADKGSAVWVY